MLCLTDCRTSGKSPSVTLAPLPPVLACMPRGSSGTPGEVPHSTSRALSPSPVAPRASSQLDSGTPPLETSDAGDGSYLPEARYGPADYDSFAPIERGESEFRHSCWKKRRLRVFKSLKRTGASGRRLLNFADCGGTLWVMADGSEHSLVCNKCHDRMCEICQKERQAAVVEGVLLRCHDAENGLRFVTLTLKHRDCPLSVQLDRLVSSFRILRTHPSIAEHMMGGVWFIECKLDKANHLWHPHLHIVVEGQFVDKRDLSAAWMDVTGDSFIVDIQTIDNPAERARYVTKYSTKPLHSAVANVPARLDEFVVAIKGRRLYQCFGTWSKAVSRAKPEKRHLTRVGHVSVLWREALAGETDSLRVMRIIHGRYPKLRGVYPLPTVVVPPEPDPP